MNLSQFLTRNPIGIISSEVEFIPFPLTQLKLYFIVLQRRMYHFSSRTARPQIKWWAFSRASETAHKKRSKFWIH